MDCLDNMYTYVEVPAPSRRDITYNLGRMKV